MKKATLTAIYETLKTMDYDPEILSELATEINKGEEQKAKNAAVYASFHDIVMDALSEATNAVTLAELWESIEDKVPEGVTKGKVQYAITRLWKDEIVKVDGNPSSYRKA